MCVLKALDQEQVDIKKDKELQQKIYVTLKKEIKHQKDKEILQARQIKHIEE